jgi:hypothetical protein
MKIIKIQIFIQDQKKYKTRRLKGRIKGKSNKIYIILEILLLFLLL